MDKQSLIVLIRKEVDNLRWAIQAHARDDERPKLRGLHIFGKRLVCSDGFRAFSIPAPQNMVTKNGDGTDRDTVLYPLTAVDSHIGIENRDEQPMDGLRIMEAKAEQQVFMFTVTSKYLAEALDMAKICVIRIYAQNPDGRPNLVVVEPMSEDGERLAFMALAAMGDARPKSYKLVPDNETQKTPTTPTL